MFANLLPSADRIDPPHGRRSFLGWLLGICTATVGVLLSVPLVRFTLYPLLTQTTATKWSDLGGLDDFTSLDAPVARTIEIEQLDGWRKTVSHKPVYVTKASGGQ